ncbi:MAG: 50S ribosome-binding GTPase [Deltaproteobacteria bacterium]|nr:50S ribosome-binding GTPase [Deltaproteobacteria bacterium]
MTTTIPQIKEGLAQFKDLLQREALFSFSTQEKEALLKGLGELGQKLSAVEASFLTIGILGGTGVGKSTIMNALAGAEIASTSHRRPHTDHVLIYKHEEAGPLPALELENLPWHVITHKQDSVKHVLLCDLPDFDSLLGEHRDRAIRFMEHLDFLVWVTSLEKYGDSRFYEFLQTAPKAKQNFIFVMNKIDLLFEGKQQESGYKELNRAVDTFKTHIRDQGIDDPLLYTLSSQEAKGTGDLSHWNQFFAFKHHLFLHRDMKQVMAIKTANLEVEAENLLSSLQAETENLKKFIAVLKESAEDFATHRPSWVQAGQEVMDSWLNNRVKAGIMRHHADPSRLVGPGYGIALLFHAFRGRSDGTSENSLDLSLFKPPEEIILSYRKRFQWAEERLRHLIHRENLGMPFEEQVNETIRAEARFDALGERFLQAVLSFVARPAPTFKLFKIYQTVFYAVLFAFFLFAVGGERAWLDFLSSPGPAKSLQLLVTMIHTLFSTKGLSALASYALLNLFLGFSFYRRYQSLLLRAGEKALGALSIAISGIWEENLDELLSDMEALKQEMASRLEALSTMRRL